MVGRIIMCVAFLACTEEQMNEYYVSDSGMENDTEMDEKYNYPRGNWGYKPMVRKLGETLIPADGNTLPNISLPAINAWDGAFIADRDLWWNGKDFAFIIWSMNDCGPCEDMYRWLENFSLINAELHKAVVLDFATEDDAKRINTSLAIAYDERRIYTREWERDHWGEVPREMPTLQVVALEDMRLLSESVGFSEDNQVEFELDLKAKINFALDE